LQAKCPEHYILLRAFLDQVLVARSLWASDVSVRIIIRVACLRRLALRWLLRLLRLLPLGIVPPSIGLAWAVTLRILLVLLIMLVRLALRWSLRSGTGAPWPAIPAWSSATIAPTSRYLERQQG
jgi:hypothetical protein